MGKSIETLKQSDILKFVWGCLPLKVLGDTEAKKGHYICKGHGSGSTLFDRLTKCSDRQVHLFQYHVDMFMKKSGYVLQYGFFFASKDDIKVSRVC